MDDVFDELRRIRHRLRELHRDLYEAIFAAITHNVPLEGISLMSALSDLQALGARIDAVTALLPIDIAAAVKAQADADAAELKTAQDALAAEQAAAAKAESDLAATVTDLTAKITALETAAGVPPVVAGLVITPTAISGSVGLAIAGAFSVTGGTAPYSFSASGQPADMSVNADGTYTVGASTAETATLSVTATDSSATPQTATVSVSVNVA